MTPGGYNQNMQVFQTEDHVVILNEMVHDSRIIPIDGSPRTGIGSWTGESRGHWEGDTLVVETTKFNGKAGYQGSADGLHLVERFTRVGANSLIYEYTASDPDSYTRPWTASIAMTHVDGDMYEFACHEGNYGMVGILSGARADEKAAAR